MPSVVFIIIISRQPKAWIRSVAGVCAIIPPNIAIVTMRPVANANLLGGNQREANRIALKKQKAPPTPITNRLTAKTQEALAIPKTNVPAVQQIIENIISFLIETRSSKRPATQTNDALA